MSNTSVTKDGNIVVVKSTDGAANNTVSIQETSTPSITVTYPDVGAPSSITKEGNTVVVKSTDGTPTAVIVQQPNNSIVTVNTLGPIGPQGPQGTPGDFDVSTVVTTSSFNAFTASYNTGSFSGSFTGVLTGTSSWASNYNEIDPVFVAKSASLATTGSNIFIGNQTITGSILMSGSATEAYISTVNWIDFNPNLAVNPPFNTGRLHWVDDTKTLGLDTDVNGSVIELGHQHVVRVVNQTGVTISQGRVVYISGSQGTRPGIATASYTDENDSATTLGFVMHDIAGTGGNRNGYVVTRGMLRDINTFGLPAGASLYLSSSGQYTTTKPQAPLHDVRLGKVIVGESTNAGVIYVDIQNGYELEELHNVRIIGDTTGDLIVKSGSLWINSKRLSGSYQLTGSLNITGSLLINGVSVSAGGAETDPIFTAVSGSFVTTSSFNTFTSSYYLDSSSFANRINNVTINTSSLVTISSFNAFTSSYNTGSFSGSFKGQLIGTSSWATTAVTALSANTATSATTAGNANVAELANTVKIQEYNNTLDFRPLLIPETYSTDPSYTSTLNNAGNLIYNGEKNLLRFDTTLDQFNNPLFPSLEIGSSSTGSLIVYGAIWAKQLNVLPSTITFVDSINTASAVTLTELKFENSKLFLTTGSYSGSFIGNLIGTASWTSNYNESDPIFVAKSGSFTLTSSFNTFTSSYKNDSSSFANRINNITFDTSSLVSSSSFNIFTSSYKTDSSSFNNKIDNLTNSTSSYVLNSQTSSFATLTSNTFNGNQIVSGTLVITGDVTIFGSSSLIYLTASQLNVGTNVISVNIFEPAQRFGGLQVYDSGSLSHQATASLLWDSQNNHWIYQNASGSLYNGGMLLSGPRNLGSLGDEPTLTANYIVKSQGGDHITTSSLFDDGTLVRINNNTQITGSLNVSLGISGSLFGTASYISTLRATGSNQEIQFNDAGVLGASNRFQFSKDFGTVTLSATASNQIFIFGRDDIDYGFLGANLNSTNEAGLFHGNSDETIASFDVINNFYRYSSNRYIYDVPNQRHNFITPVIISGSTLNTIGNVRHIISSSDDFIIYSNNAGFSNTPFQVTSNGEVFIAGPLDVLGGNIRVYSASFIPGIGGRIESTELYVGSGDSAFVGSNHTLHVSPGYVNITGSLNITSGNITGNLIGTSSWATNAVTASFLPIGTYNITSSWSLNSLTSSYTVTSQTASYVLNAISSSYALTASYALNAGGSGVATLIDTLGARIYTDDTFITAGSKGYKHIAYDADIIKTRTIANTNGNIDINIKRNNVTLGTISLLNQSSSLDTTLTGWTTQLNTNDLLEFYVSQSSTYITDISIFIDIQSR